MLLKSGDFDKHTELIETIVEQALQPGRVVMMGDEGAGGSKTPPPLLLDEVGRTEVRDGKTEEGLGACVGIC